MKYSIKIFYTPCIILLLLMSHLSYAVPLQNLYRTSVAVASQLPQERERVLAQALLQVLIKVSGNKSIASLTEITPQLVHAGQLLEQYSYERSKEDKQKLYLNVRFDSKAVNALLQQAGQAIWGAERPVLLVWLLQANTQGPNLITTDTAHAWLASLTHTAQLRGVPLLFPLGDLNDLSQLQLQAIWQGDGVRIKKASQRYGEQPILVVCIQQQANQWQGRWQLLLEDEAVTWHTQNARLTTLLELGMHRVADVLAQRYAVVNTQAEPETITLLVNHIKDVAHYTKVMHYLRQLTPVTRVEVEEVTPQQVRFSLAVKGGMVALENILRQQSILLPSNDTAMGNTEAMDNLLKYDLNS